MNLPIRHQLNLKPFNTFGIAAQARVVYTLEHSGQLDALLAALDAEARACGKRPLILSGGSNMLLARDLDEPVLQVRTQGRQLLGQEGDSVLIDVAAGEIWHDTVRWSLAEGYSGLENLVLIPGRVGAAPLQNIGAYGVEVGERIDSVEAVHLPSGEHRRFAAAACAFGYRQSFFKTPAGRDWLILSVRLRLSRRFEPRLGYGELAATLEAQQARDPATRPASDPQPPSRPQPADAPLSATQVADAVEAIRRRKLPDPAVLGNAGSFFHNPVVDAGTLHALRAQHPALPAHPVADAGGPAVAGRNDSHDAQSVNPADAPASTSAITHYKLSAGWLIDACGWKGYRDGDAGVSPQHALVLVNHGQATGAQILGLAERIQHSVFERFGVHLHPEPVILR